MSAPHKQTDAIASADAQEPDTHDRVEHPQAHFAHPIEVVIDPQMSGDEKVLALKELEQDARQLSSAAAEGMAGAGEGSGLRDVLVAQDMLDLPPFDLAVSAALQSLRAKRRSTTRTDLIMLTTCAIESLEAVSAAVRRSEREDAGARDSR